MADGKDDTGKKVQKALASVVEALGDLDDGARARVLTSAAAFYGTNVALPKSTEEETGSANAGVPAGTASGNHGRAVSLREFMNDKKPSTVPQKIATFAYYREHYEKKPKFARADLLPYFGTAKEGEPGNYGRDFANAVKEGWIHEKGADSYLTSTGMNAVEAGFGGKAKPRGAAAAKKKRNG